MFWENDFLPPDLCGLFQMGGSLFVCGGTEEYAGSEHESTSLYELDFQGRYQ